MLWFSSKMQKFVVFVFVPPTSSKLCLGSTPCPAVIVHSQLISHSLHQYAVTLCYYLYCFCLSLCLYMCFNISWIFFPLQMFGVSVTHRERQHSACQCREKLQRSDRWCQSDPARRLWWHPHPDASRRRPQRGRRSDSGSDASGRPSCLWIGFLLFACVEAHKHVYSISGIHKATQER